MSLWVQFGTRSVGVLLALCVVIGTAISQEIPIPSSDQLPARAKLGAVTGQPFGILVVEIPLDAQQRRLEIEPRVLVTDDQNRVFYPVVRTNRAAPAAVPANGTRPRIGRPGGLIDRLRSAVNGQPEAQVPVSITVAALFRGSQPINLQLQGDVQQQLQLVPNPPTAAMHREMLDRWWSLYVSSAREAIAKQDFPRLVHGYLVSTLARRLGLPPVSLEPESTADEDDLEKSFETLQLLANAESLRESTRSRLLNAPQIEPEPATLPIPPAPSWEPTLLPPLAEPPVIEELAHHIPPECFYLRFGAFENFVWFQEIAERYGGDIAQSVLLRGFSHGAAEKTERMLAAKMTQVAKLFGDQVVGDMAVFGSDLYLAEGPSLGVVFLAKNPGLLNVAIESDRQSVVAKTPGASLQDLEIEGTKVRLLSTPDNRIRSYYASQGSYVCVTTSRSLITRFLQVSKGAPALADSPSFQWARTWMVEDNAYSVFAFLSPEFLQRLVSPQYQIELRRRMEAIASLEIAEMASQVAAAEGVPGDNIDALIAAGLLPPSFNDRPDGAQTLRSEGRWIDSMRGARGSFLPIADIQLQGATRDELEEYGETASFYLDQWKRMDPMVVGIRRFQSPVNQNQEKIVVEGYIAPFEAEKYGWVADKLAPPSNVELILPTDDVANIQIQMKDDSLVGTAVGGNYILFAGLKDMMPPAASQVEGFFQILQLLRNSPAYVGGWPKPGIVEQLPLGIGRNLAKPDIDGFSRMIGGLWRWQDGAFSLLSFDRAILENARQQLGVRQANDSAQVRLDVQVLQNTQVGDWLNQYWYERGWKASHANATLLDVVNQQLKVPSNQCMEATERLLDVKLQCPIGGEYRLENAAGSNAGWWVSSGWDNTMMQADIPILTGGYVAPWVDWFRGGKAHVTQGANSLSVLAEFEVEMQPLPVDLVPTTMPSLPTMNFDLFSLPTQLFGGAKAPAGPEIQRREF